MTGARVVDQVTGHQHSQAVERMEAGALPDEALPYLVAEQGFCPPDRAVETVPLPAQSNEIQPLQDQSIGRHRAETRTR